MSLPEVIGTYIPWAMAFFSLALVLISRRRLGTHKGPIVAVVAAMMAGLGGKWFTDSIALQFQSEMGEWGKLTVSATGSFGLFIFVFVMILRWYAKVAKENSPGPDSTPRETRSQAAGTKRVIEREVILREREIITEKPVDDELDTLSVVFIVSFPSDSPLPDFEVSQ